MDLLFINQFRFGTDNRRPTKNYENAIASFRAGPQRETLSGLLLYPGTSAGFFNRVFNAPLPPEAKKILKI